MKKVHAANGPLNQVCRNLSLRRSVSILRKHIAAGAAEREEKDSVLEFCYYLENRCTQKTLKVGEHRYFGKKRIVNEDTARQFNLSENETVRYGKLVRDKCLFKSSEKKCRRSDSSMAITKDGQFIEIFEFLVDLTDNKEYTLCKVLNAGRSMTHNGMSGFEVDSIDANVIAIETSNIEKACVYMSVNGKKYVSPTPNSHLFS